jgi:hypothetical protein
MHIIRVTRTFTTTVNMTFVPSKVAIFESLQLRVPYSTITSVTNKEIFSI